MVHTYMYIRARVRVWVRVRVLAIVAITVYVAISLSMRTTSVTGSVSTVVSPASVAGQPLETAFMFGTFLVPQVEPTELSSSSSSSSSRTSNCKNDSDSWESPSSASSDLSPTSGSPNSSSSFFSPVLLLGPFTSCSPYRVQFLLPNTSVSINDNHTNRLDLSPIPTLFPPVPVAILTSWSQGCDNSGKARYASAAFAFGSSTSGTGNSPNTIGVRGPTLRAVLIMDEWPVVGHVAWTWFGGEPTARIVPIPVYGRYWGPGSQGHGTTQCAPTRSGTNSNSNLTQTPAGNDDSIIEASTTDELIEAALTSPLYSVPVLTVAEPDLQTLTPLLPPFTVSMISDPMDPDTKLELITVTLSPSYLTEYVFLFLVPERNPWDDWFPSPASIAYQVILSAFCGFNVISAFYRVWAHIGVYGLEWSLSQVCLGLEILCNLERLLFTAVDPFGSERVFNFPARVFLITFSLPLSFIVSLVLVFFWREVSDSGTARNLKIVTRKSSIAAIAFSAILFLTVEITCDYIQARPASSADLYNNAISLQLGLYGVFQLVVGCLFIWEGRKIYMLRKHAVEELILVYGLSRPQQSAPPGRTGGLSPTPRVYAGGGGDRAGHPSLPTPLCELRDRNDPAGGSSASCNVAASSARAGMSYTTMAPQSGVTVFADGGDDGDDGGLVMGVAAGDGIVMPLVEQITSVEKFPGAVTGTSEDAMGSSVSSVVGDVEATVSLTRPLTRAIALHVPFSGQKESPRSPHQHVSAPGLTRTRSADVQLPRPVGPYVIAEERSSLGTPTVTSAKDYNEYDGADRNAARVGSSVTPTGAEASQCSSSHAILPVRIFLRQEQQQQQQDSDEAVSGDLPTTPVTKDTRTTQDSRSHTARRSQASRVHTDDAARRDVPSARFLLPPSSAPLFLSPPASVPSPSSSLTPLAGLSPTTTMTHSSSEAVHPKMVAVQRSAHRLMMCGVAMLAYVSLFLVLAADPTLYENPEGYLIFSGLALFTSLIVSICHILIFARPVTPSGTPVVPLSSQNYTENGRSSGANTATPTGAFKAQ